MKSSRLRIAILDDGVHKGVLQAVTPYAADVSITCLQMRDGYCAQQPDRTTSGVNHGTACLLILLETLSRNNLIDRVEVISLSIADKQGRNNLQNLSDAMRWAVDEHMDLMSISVGSAVFTTAGKIIEAVQYAQQCNVTIVAAGSNDGSIAYPACLDAVIGVGVAAQAHVCLHTPDGINVWGTLPEMAILHSLKDMYSMRLPQTSSLITPYVAAQAAGVLLDHKSACTSKASMLAHLANTMQTGIAGECFDGLPCWMESTATEASEEKAQTVPVIGIEYNRQNKRFVMELAIELQERFLQDGYDCAYFCHFAGFNFHEKNRFHLWDGNEEACLKFFSANLKASLILIVIREAEDGHDVSLHLGDAVVSARAKRDDRPAFYLETIGFDNNKQVCQDIYDWILRVFQR